MMKRRLPVKQKLQALRGGAKALAKRAKWLVKGERKPRTPEELSKVPFEELLEETLFELKEQRLTAGEIARVLPELRLQLQRLYLAPESKKRGKNIKELSALIPLLDAELKRLNVSHK